MAIGQIPNFDGSRLPIPGDSQTDGGSESAHLDFLGRAEVLSLGLPGEPARRQPAANQEMGSMSIIDGTPCTQSPRTSPAAALSIIRLPACNLPAPAPTPRTLLLAALNPQTQIAEHDALTKSIIA